MNIVVGRPPIYDDVVRMIGKPPAAAVFTWGETLYVGNPPPGMKHLLDPALMEHEKTHSRQQAKDGAGPWWARFLKSPEFRLEQEVEAYRAQYQFVCRHGASRQVRRATLRQLAKDLAGPLYGNIVKFAAAVELISGQLPEEG